MANILANMLLQHLLIVVCNGRAEACHGKTVAPILVAVARETFLIANLQINFKLLSLPSAARLAAICYQYNINKAH